MGNHHRPAQQQWQQQPPQNRQGAGQFWIGESGGSQNRTMFDDKIAVTEKMRYPVDGITEKEKEKNGEYNGGG